MEIYNHIKEDEPNPNSQKEILKVIFKVNSYRALVTEHYAQYKKTLDMGMSLFDEYMNIIELENALDCVDREAVAEIAESNTCAISAEEMEAISFQES
jgi:hypothetical protein